MGYQVTLLCRNASAIYRAPFSPILFWARPNEVSAYENKSIIMKEVKLGDKSLCYVLMHRLDVELHRHQ